MATIKNLGNDTTEIKIDRLNAVLFYQGSPIAAVVAGGGFKTDRITEDINFLTLQWLLIEWEIAGPSFRPQEFFDNILKIYMNPAALDAPVEKGEE